MIQGRDYSHWEPSPNLDADRAEGVAFCIDKLTDGLTVDPTFEPRFQRERALGFLTAAYHYYRDAVDPARQAHFHRDASPVPLSVLDLEPAYNPTFTRDNSPDELKIVTQKIHVCLQTLEDRMKRKPPIYTNWNTWHYLLGEPPWGADYPLWVASYPKTQTSPPTGAPVLPLTWKAKGWVLWQTGDHTDWFNGTRADLLALFAPPYTVSLPIIQTAPPPDALQKLWDAHPNLH